MSGPTTTFFRLLLTCYFVAFLPIVLFASMTIAQSIYPGIAVAAAAIIPLYKINRKNEKSRLISSDDSKKFIPLDERVSIYASMIDQKEKREKLEKGQ